MRSLIHRLNRPKVRPDPEGFSALLFFLLLVVNDWLLARQLRSPAGLLTWLGEVTDTNITATADGDILDLVVMFLASPYFPLILIVLTALLWVFGARRGLLVPLCIYLAWATLQGVGSLIVVGINLFNPNTEAEVLLIDTFILWVSNMIVFATWYWLIDHVGQAQ